LYLYSFIELENYFGTVVCFQCPPIVSVFSKNVRIQCKVGDAEHLEQFKQAQSVTGTICNRHNLHHTGSFWTSSKSRTSLRESCLLLFK